MGKWPTHARLGEHAWQIPAQRDIKQSAVGTERGVRALKMASFEV